MERIDTGAIYHKLTIGQLQEEVPQIDWLEYFSVLLHPLPINTSEPVVSYSTPYFLQLGELLAQTDKKWVHNILQYFMAGNTYSLRLSEIYLIRN